MDEKKISEERKAILGKIEEYEKKGWFDRPIENDPEAPELLPEKVDYLCKKCSSRFKRWVANAVADRYFLNLIKKDVITIDGVEGEEYLADGLKHGAIVTCNHFSPFDNYIVFHCIRKFLPKKYLYKIIREGNYTNFPGLYGFFFRHCNTLPLSRNRRTMMNFMSATNALLKDGESILVYPEQEMWFNYKKPRKYRDGAFHFAAQMGVPVIPTFTEMRNYEGEYEDNGFLKVKHIIHVMPPIYPDPNLSVRENRMNMMKKEYEMRRELYERVYGIPLTDDFDPERDIAGYHK
jgi:1-acyl-sn-glycerol-3-phosphate acyltransferase